MFKMIFFFVFIRTAENKTRIFFFENKNTLIKIRIHVKILFLDFVTFLFVDFVMSRG